MTLSASRFPNTTNSTVEDTTLASKSRQILASSLNSKNSHYTIEVKSDGNKSATVTIPAAALRLLVETLAQMAQGNAVSLVPIKKELSTSEAADLLNVSRPYLVDLLESGKIPFRKIGPRRRVLLEDVMAYKNQIDAQREQTLAELVAQAQELNLGYE